MTKLAIDNVKTVLRSACQGRAERDLFWACAGRRIRASRGCSPSSQHTLSQHTLNQLFSRNRGGPPLARGATQR